MANVNQAIDETIAQRLCSKYGFKFEVEKRDRGGGTVHAPKKATEIDTEDKPEQLTKAVRTLPINAAAKPEIETAAT